MDWAKTTATWDEKHLNFGIVYIPALCYFPCYVYHQIVLYFYKKMKENQCIKSEFEFQI